MSKEVELVSSDERKVLLDRRFAFYGDAERIVWTELEREMRLALVSGEL